MATQVEVLQLLKRLAQAFGEIKVHPSIYAVALKDADASVFDTVFDDLVINYKYGWPRPSDIRDAAERARANKGLSFERCPSCECPQWQLVNGAERFCMACHTDWEITNLLNERKEG